MKIGQVEFTWRAHRQACVVKIGGEQRVFRFNKKTTRKELFAKIRSLIAEAAGTQKVCQHCGKHYAECYEIVKAYIKEHADFAKELQAYMQQQYR